MSTQQSPDIPGWEAVVAAGRVAPPSHEVVVAAQAAVASLIREADRGVADASGGLALTRPVRGLFSGRRWQVGLAGVAAAATCGLAVVATGSPGASGSQARAATTQPAGGVGARSAAFFNGIAQIQEAQTTVLPQTWKLEIASTQAGAASQHYTEVLDRSGITVVDGGKKVHKDRAVTWRLGAGSVDWSGLDKLTTDPATLRAQLSALGPGNAFDEIGDLLGESPASPALRSALYRVLGQLPGVEVTGRAADSSGRVGSVVEFSADGTTERFIIDPSTGALLEKTQIAAKATAADTSCGAAGADGGHCAPALRAGDVISRQTYLQSGPAGAAS